MDNLTVRKVSISLILAGLLTSVLYFSVVQSFHKQRWRLITESTSPRGENPLRLLFIADKEYLPRQTLATGSISNQSGEAIELVIRLNRQRLVLLSLDPGETQDFQFLLPDLLPGKNRLEVVYRQPQWALNSLEVRNFFGFSSKYATFVLAPSAHEAGIKNIAAIVVFFLLVFGASFIYPWGITSRWLKVHRIFVAVTLILFTSSLVLPWVSQYFLFIGLDTFLEAIILAALPSFVWGYRWLAARNLTHRVVHVPAVALIVFLFYLSATETLLAKYEYNYSGFLHIARRRLERAVVIPEVGKLKPHLLTVTGAGYDGQLFYYMSFDPFLVEHEPATYKQIIDLPPFRYRRILFSLLTVLFSLNHPEIYPAVMMYIILLSTSLGAMFLAEIAGVFGRSRLWGLLFLLVPGFMFALSVATPEAVAACCILGGTYFYLTNRRLLSLLFFALALLTRESSILFLLVFAGYDWYQKKPDWRWLLPVVAYGCWRSYVTIRLYPAYGMNGFFVEPGNLSLPFKGIAEVYIALNNHQYPIEVAPSAILLSSLLIIMLLTGFFYLKWPETRPYSLCLLLYSFLAISLDFKFVWKNVTNVERQSYESFLALILIFFATPKPFGLRTVVIISIFVLIFLYDYFFTSQFLLFQAPFKDLWRIL